MRIGSLIRTAISERLGDVWRNRMTGRNDKAFFKWIREDNKMWESRARPFGKLLTKVRHVHCQLNSPRACQNRRVTIVRRPGPGGEGEAINRGLTSRRTGRISVEPFRVGEKSYMRTHSRSVGRTNAQHKVFGGQCEATRARQNLLTWTSRPNAMRRMRTAERRERAHVRIPKLRISC